MRQANLYAAKAQLSELVQAALDAAFSPEVKREVADLFTGSSS